MKQNQIKINSCEPSSQRMVQFIDKLYSKYKILSKLTEKQSSDFQNEVIFLLVDENQNVDIDAYRDVIENVGLDAFVLQILGKCVNRSPFANQYELKKNINNIADDLQKQTKQIGKKAKVLQRRQSNINKLEATLKSRIKEYAVQVQKDFMNKAVAKEAQIKKSINCLLNNLKLKQKLIGDRRDEIVKRLSELSFKEKGLLVLQKQKEAKRINNSDNNQQITDQFPTIIPNSKNTKEIKQLNKKIQEMKADLQKLRKKYKTTELAYSKVKNDLVEQEKQNKRISAKIEEIKEEHRLQKEKQKEREREREREKQVDCCIKSNNTLGKNAQNCLKNNDMNTNQLIDMLDLLQISQIQNDSVQLQQKKRNNSKKLPLMQLKKQQCEQNEILIKNSKIKNFIKQKNEHKMEGSHIKNNFSLADQSTNPSKQNIQAFNNYFNQNIQNNNNHQKQLKSQSFEEQESHQCFSKQRKVYESQIYQNSNGKLQQQDSYQQSQSNQSALMLSFLKQPKHLKPCAQQNTQQPGSQILTKISNAIETSIPELLKSNLLLSFINLPSFEHNIQNLTSFFDILLDLIQQSCPYYYEAIQYMSNNQFTQMFQKSYLSYESNIEIAEATTLFLTRILMVSQAELKFQECFVNAIKLRANVLNQDNVNESESFLKANIDCLLSMI